MSITKQKIKNKLIKYLGGYTSEEVVSKYNTPMHFEIGTYRIETCYAVGETKGRAAYCLSEELKSFMSFKNYYDEFGEYVTKASIKVCVPNFMEEE